MKSIFNILLLFLFSASFMAGSVKGEIAGNQPDTTGALPVEEIENIFAIYNTDSEPGCAVSVYQEGNNIYKNSFGLSNLDYGIALSDSSAFYMASVSKHVTAAAAGLLVIRGELDETALVSDYIKDWPEYASNVTISQLFSHTSGLPDIYGLMNIAGIPLNNPMNIEDYMDLIYNGESLKFEPGTDYAYTNSGYTTLAHLIEIITEKPFARFVESEFFEPFGMKSTHFHSDRQKIIPNRVISYRPGDEQFRHTYLGMFQGVGPGGLYSTLNDWSKWEAFWYGSLEWRGGITTEEAADLKAWMVTPARANGEELKYGMGLHIEKRKGQQLIGHGGSFMGFRTDYRRYPEHGFSFLTLCNRGDAEPHDLNNRVADLFLQEEFERYLSPYGGIYRNEELPVEYEITVVEGNLHLIRQNSPNGMMTEDAEDIWRAGSWDFVFKRDDSGQIHGFVVATGRARDVEFTKLGE